MYITWFLIPLLTQGLMSIAEHLKSGKQWVELMWGPVSGWRSGSRDQNSHSHFFFISCSLYLMPGQAVGKKILDPLHCDTYSQGIRRAKASPLPCLLGLAVCQPPASFCPPWWMGKCQARNRLNFDLLGCWAVELAWAAKDWGDHAILTWHRADGRSHICPSVLPSHASGGSNIKAGPYSAAPTWAPPDHKPVYQLHFPPPQISAALLDGCMMTSAQDHSLSNATERDDCMP